MPPCQPPFSIDDSACAHRADRSRQRPSSAAKPRVFPSPGAPFPEGGLFCAVAAEVICIIPPANCRVS